jgi:Fe-Mn family superoxide dismutase
MSFELPELPYAIDALEPYVSATTLEFHHGKHHCAYVDKLNRAIEGTGYAELPLESIIARSHGTTHTQVYNNAAQAWNHAFLWQSMSPEGGGSPQGRLLEMLNESFGDQARFEEAFKAAAAGQFGSGWAWLVQEGSTLKVVGTANADTPLVMNQKPLLTLDVWEHAYYLDYQNDRGRYIDDFLQHLLNWKFAEQTLAG